jgi:CMP-N-acetylneuraminic acid synthetase
MVAVLEPKILGLVTARGGSKRLPGKNIRDFHGKPLIAWTIEAAKASKLISDTIVSTDSTEITSAAEKAGAWCPFVRPPELASDQASSLDVLKHALLEMKDKFEKNYDWVILLQPTSPLRNVDDIDGAIRLAIEKNAESVISVCQLEHPRSWEGVLPPSLSMGQFFFGESEPMPKDPQTVYRLNGAVFVCRVSQFLKSPKIYGANSFGYVMPKERSIDIDTQYDFIIAEALAKGLSCFLTDP